MIEGFQPRIVTPKPRFARSADMHYQDRIEELDRMAKKIFMTEVNKRRFRHIYLEHAYTRK